MEAVAKLKNYPTGPRKMRLLADVIRGMEVEKALAILEHHPQHSATPLAKLLKSAISNWEQGNSGQSAADSNLIVKTVFVDGGRILKRMRPAPQGRGYRVRKRSNHVTLIVDAKGGKVKAEIKKVEVEPEVKVEDTVAVKPKKATAKKTTTKKTKETKNA
jgi:large subunit ribosomal protein L22